MRCFARTSLGLLGLALIAPITARAQDAYSSAPAGYRPAAVQDPAPATAPMGLDGKPAPAPAVVAEAPHQHKGRTLCARCAAKQQQANALPPGKIVGCSHSKNGVCTACAAALNMPGQFVMSGGAAPEAPGRAMASSSAVSTSPSGGPGSAIAYDNGAGDPLPVGVIQAGYAQPSPTGMQAPLAQPAAQPGRAVVESGMGHDPYQAKSGSFPHPHILGHLFGWSGLGAERAQERAKRKAEAHAMISYETNGANAPVEELPASVVYGKKH